MLTYGVGGAENDRRRAYSAKQQSLHYVSDKAGAGGVNAIFDDIAQSEHGYVYVLYICIYMHVCVCACLCVWCVWGVCVCVCVCYLLRSSKYTVAEIYFKSVSSQGQQQTPSQGRKAHAQGLDAGKKMSAKKNQQKKMT